MAMTIKAEERVEKIRNVMIELGLPFKQVCGQRIFGPPRHYNGERPAKGCEVFVTNIPRDVCEDEIIRMFAAAGYLYEIKFMMEFSGLNRGFAYFLYVDRASAMKAIKLYHGCVMSPGEKRLACYISLDNSKLYFEGLPKHLPAEEAGTIMKNLFDECEKVTIFQDPSDSEKNLGIGFVEFATHRRAAEIRKMLWPSRLGVMGNELYFEWAVPLPNFQEYHVIIIANLSPKVNNKVFTTFVLKHIQGRGCICNITKRESFATIQCLSSHQAIRCARQLSEQCLDGYPLKVFVIDNNGTTHDPLTLFLQWAVYEQRSTVVTALCDFLSDPLATIAKLAPKMQHYLRDTNSLMSEICENAPMSECTFETDDEEC